MKVYIPSDPKFNYKECKALYNKHKKLIRDTQEFDQILNSTLFYSFFTNENKFIGCVYFYLKDSLIYVNGFANRKMHPECIQILKLSSTWFNCDIHAETPHRTAALCLLRAGFKKFDNQLYIKKKGDYHGR